MARESFHGSGQARPTRLPALQRRERSHEPAPRVSCKIALVRSRLPAVLGVASSGLAGHARDLPA